MQKMGFGSTLFLAFLMCSTKEATSMNRNVNNSENISTFIQRYLRPQPARIKRICAWVSGINMRQGNGTMEVTCLRNRTMIGEYIQNTLRKSDRSSSARISRALQIKANAYLARDSTVAVCRLHCARGKPFLRHRPMPFSGLLEPNDVNVGCDDKKNMRCRDFCSVSSVDVSNGDVECSESFFSGSLCTLRCHRGYSPRGATKKLCLHQTWYPHLPFVCDRDVVSCDELPQVENGILNCSMGNNLYSKCRLTCYDNYDPVGPLEQWCVPTKKPNSTAMWLVVNRRNASTKAVEKNHEMRCLAPANLRRYDTRNCPTLIPLKMRIYCKTCRTRFQCSRQKFCWDRWTENLMHRCYDPRQRRSSWRAAATTPQPNEETNTFGTSSVGHPRSDFPPGCVCTATRPSLRTCSASDATVPSVTPSGTQIVAQPSVNARFKSLPSTRIYNGQDASPRDWPWHAVLSFNNYLCGGTLISNRHVITAAHCVTLSTGGVVTSGEIFVGVTNISNPTPKLTQSRRAAKVIRHHNFSSTANLHSRNDIAIIVLDVPVKVNGAFVKPLCLPRNRTPRISDECYVTGFGKLYGTGPISQVLQQACVPRVSRSKCQRIYGDYVVPFEHLCAGGGGRNSADTCRGDSGGPLVCRRPGSGHCGWYLAGITSFGQSPCGSGTPSVYVNVSHYHDWIFETIRRTEWQSST